MGWTTAPHTNKHACFISISLYVLVKLWPYISHWTIACVIFFFNFQFLILMGPCFLTVFDCSMWSPWKRRNSLRFAQIQKLNGPSRLTFFDPSKIEWVMAFSLRLVHTFCSACDCKLFILVILTNHKTGFLRIVALIGPLDDWRRRRKCRKNAICWSRPS